jgi:hypothetical protein
MPTGVAFATEKVGCTMKNSQGLFRISPVRLFLMSIVDLDLGLGLRMFLVLADVTRLALAGTTRTRSKSSRCWARLWLGTWRRISIS